MLKITVISIITLCLDFSGLNSTSLEVLRKNYVKLISDKELCRNTIIDLEKNSNNSAIHLAYLGGSQTIWANHVINPFSKLSTFKEGKRKIELAVKKEPNNIEVRFIRLSVQKNAPSFLGYRSNIKEDTELVERFRHQLSSKALQSNIEGLLN